MNKWSNSGLDHFGLIKRVGLTSRDDCILLHQCALYGLALFAFSCIVYNTMQKHELSDFHINTK